MVTRNTAPPGQYLTIRLGSQNCGIQVRSIREINQMSDIVEVPSTPKFVLGIINLRGKIVPVVDLKVKFGMQATKVTKQSCIVVIDCNQEQVGIIVDEVNEVVDLKDDEIEQPPHIGGEEDLSYLMGIGKSKNKIIILIDVVQTLSKDQFLKSVFVNLEKLVV